MREYVTHRLGEFSKIYCCGDCLYYDWKKHKCKLGAKDNGTGHEHFYRDCPIGIYTEEDNPQEEA